MASMAEGDEGMNVGSMEPRRRAGRRISGSRGCDIGVRDRRQMRASRPGSGVKASGASQSECQTPGDTRGVWSDSGEVRVRIGDRSEGGVQ